MEIQDGTQLLQMRSKVCSVEGLKGILFRVIKSPFDYSQGVLGFLLRFHALSTWLAIFSDVNSNFFFFFYFHFLQA